MNVAAPLASPDSNLTYSVSERTCGDTATAQVSVNVLDTPTVSLPYDSCLQVSDSLSIAPSFVPDSTTPYLVVQESGCDSTSDPLELRVHPNPAIDAGADRSIAQGEEISIGSEADSGIVYQWLPVQGLTRNESTPTRASPERSRTYVLHAFDDSTGCSSRDSVRIEVRAPVVFIPNVFSPTAKGDAENLKFRVQGGPFEEYHLQVFSRWGELVFESREANEAWKGRYKGEPMKGGVYSYQFRGVLENGEEVERSGTVTLLR